MDERVGAPGRTGLRIGELAALAGVSVRSLRYYEEQGLLEADRDMSGYRRYDLDAPARVARIQLLLAAGLCSSKIGELLPSTDGDGESVTLSADLVDELEIARRRIDAQIDDLRASQDVLDRLLAASRRGDATPLLTARPSRPARGSLDQRVMPPSFR